MKENPGRGNLTGSAGWRQEGTGKDTKYGKRSGIGNTPSFIAGNKEA